MMRVKRACGTRSWWGAPRPAHQTSQKSIETALRSKFSEIGDYSSSSLTILSQSSTFGTPKPSEQLSPHS